MAYAAYDASRMASHLAGAAHYAYPGSSIVSYYPSPPTSDQTPHASPFLVKAPLLDDVPSHLAMALSQVCNSLEAFARQFRVRSPAMQQHRQLGEALLSWVRLVVPPLAGMLRALAQLREVAEAVWRAAGGYIAATHPAPVTVEVEAPDPQGGSHSVSSRQVLAPVSPAVLSAFVEKMRLAARGLASLAEEQGRATQRLIGEAERFVAVLLPAERTALQHEAQLPGGAVPQQHVKTLLHAVVQLARYPQQLSELLSAICLDPTISNGTWFHPYQARDLFRAYRHVEASIVKASTQAENAHRFMLEQLRTAGYLPSSASSMPTSRPLSCGGSNSSGLGRAQTYPTLSSPDTLRSTSSFRPPSASGIRRSPSPGFYPSSAASSSGFGGLPGGIKK
ncbi:hypothetical protein JCM10207_000864 [Rhodosporidiobolus poonsookiae]